MIETEKEAKTKLCPRAIGPGSMDWNFTPDGRTCAASACMAWRWAEWHVDESTHQRLDGFKGYCGLAGRP